MLYKHALVDLDKLPAEVKDMVIHIAERHNALVQEASNLKVDIDNVTGSTPEEKEEVYGILAKARAVLHFFHNKRFNTTLGIFQAYLLLSVLKQFGVTPDQVAALMEKLLHILEKVAGLGLL